MQHGNLVRAARQAGITRQAHYLWLKRPNYAEAFRKTQTQAGEYIESIAVDRATDGWLDPVFYQGQKCGQVRRYDSGLLQFLLRGMLPEKYGAQRTEVSGPQGTPIQHKIQIEFIKPGDTDSNREQSQVP